MSIYDAISDFLTLPQRQALESVQQGQVGANTGLGQAITSGVPSSQYNAAPSMAVGNPTLNMIQPQQGQAYQQPGAQATAGNYMNQGLTALPDTPQPPRRPANLGNAGQGFNNFNANVGGAAKPFNAQAPAQQAPSTNQLMGLPHGGGDLTKMLKAFGITGQDILNGLGGAVGGIGQGINTVGTGIGDGITGALDGMFHQQ